jgi:hypothetical protein
VSGEEDAGAEDLGDLWRKRMEGYAELWQTASGKLSEGRYRSDDLLDDWFRWCGMAARDATAAATLLFRLPTDDTPSTADADAEG